MNAQEKFQQLLQELFEFESADLDFGIYRILNHKRQVIEHWINEDLPKAIEEEFRRGALAEQAQAQQALKEAQQKVLEVLGEDAIGIEGSLAEPYLNTKVGREYLKARAKAAHTQSSKVLEAAIYNHLYTFFSRYYQDGDFISKRRYSKKERYAVPYNGEEVYLYWANHDQYYVKTAEHFTDYTWKAPNGVTVHFKLKAADVEVNNVKGEKRFFLARLDEMTWLEKTRTLIIPFQYRPLTEQEKIAYGNKNQQDKIIDEVLEAIHARLKHNADALAALTAERRRDAKGNPVSYLEHHLRQYTARNTHDFFIHKDLRSFLSRELDFYLKNEVLNLDEMEAAGEDLAEGWFQLMRLIKRIGNHIIDFLAQIEDFQKALWEKKKFVTETFWCITVGHIPEGFYPEIAENEAQWQEWQELFHIHELPKDICSGDLNTKECRIAFLKDHPTLVLDTRHFSQDFTDRSLASFDNLDEMTDGLLVHSENWQALNLLLEKYRERVKTIYIDPPYNTGSDEFLYRDAYQHSSWLTMMDNRLRRSGVLLASDGLVFVHIDEREQARLDGLMQEIYGAGNSIGPFIWLARVGKAVTERLLQVKHEYVMCARASEEARLKLVRKEVTGRYEDDRGRYNREQLRQWGGQGDRREDRPSLYFPIPTPFGVDVYPKRPDGSDGRWRASREEVKKMLEAGDLDFVRDEKTGEIKVYRKVREGTVTVSAPSNILDDCGTSTTATLEIKALFGDKVFDTAKPVALAQRCISLDAEDVDAFVLDFFAGSGTTGHAVINLNREDGGRRKFILVEMAHYFDTVLLPRIKKVTFTPEWKDGKPKRMATQEEFERGPRIVKVIRLESYEDALNNISFDEESGQKALDLFGEEYLLRYMLKWEAKKSETFLDVGKLQSPFSYKLRIHRDGETREQPVDLPETFAYLIGLDVERRQVLHDGKRRYLVHRGTTREGRKVAVIWRETKGWSREGYERDARFTAERRLTEGADEVFTNGDSYIPGARSLDGLFKARLFGQEA
ncbi:MAG: site-specific DNA-methyltransferase [Nitrospiraceae bacterium]|nr:site-specific DNA-methyltransferase [Nitrospiraceae bacterium]